jgi:hypothetical protein
MFIYAHARTHAHTIFLPHKMIKKKFPKITLHLNTGKLNFIESAKNTLLIVARVLSLSV